jgi:capsular exopolysaccharide synthesis family protein
MKDAPVIEAQLAGLLREQRISNEIYISLLSKFEEYKVQEAAKIGSAKIIEPAVTSIKPVLPKKKVILGLAILFGISAGLTIIFGVYYFKGLPSSVEDIKKILGNNIVGTIPFQNKMEHPLFVRDCPDTVTTEAIRLIQTNIKLKLSLSNSNEGRGSVILVTSTQPGEGKSTIAANLAYSYSSSAPTLLMNMDFRRPSFKKIFGESLLDTGIVEGIDGYETLTRYIQQVGTLDVVNSGAMHPNPLDLVQSHAMKNLIAKLKEKYKLIIIDSAPITMVAETLELLKFADVVTAVVDMSSVKLKNLYSLKTGMNTGIIINKAFKTNSGYYYKSYR